MAWRRKQVTTTRRVNGVIRIKMAGARVMVKRAMISRTTATSSVPGCADIQFREGIGKVTAPAVSATLGDHHGCNHNQPCPPDQPVSLIMIPLLYRNRDGNWKNYFPRAYCEYCSLSSKFFEQRLKSCGLFRRCKYGFLDLSKTGQRGCAGGRNPIRTDSS